MINRAQIGIALAGVVAVGVVGFAFGYRGGGDVGEDASTSLGPLETATADTPVTTEPEDTADSDDSEVLGVDVDDEEEAEGEEPTPTTTVAVPGPSPAPTPTLPLPVPTPTTAPPAPTPAPTPTTVPPTPVPTPTTVPAPSPTVEAASVAHSTMIRRYLPQPGACEAQATSVGAREVSTLTATGVAHASNVTYEVRVGHAGGPVLADGSMTSAGTGTWRTQLGPYPWTNNDDPNSDRAIWVRVYASGNGETNWATTTFYLRNCVVPD